MDECFHCMGPATERYTLILVSGKVLEDKLVCDECIADFRDIEWIEGSESPVLMRGGNDDSTEEGNTDEQ